MMPKNLFKKEIQSETTEASIPGLERLARLVAASKAIEALIDQTDKQVKAEAVRRFVSTGSKKSFDAIDGSAKANVQVRKRQARSKLSDEECKLLKDNGISVEKVVAQPEAFSVNPKYASDKKLLAKVSKALGNIVPEDFFEYQPEICHFATSEASIDECLASPAGADLLSIVGTLAIRTSYDDAQGAIASAIEGLLEGKV